MNGDGRFILFIYFIGSMQQKPEDRLTLEDLLVRLQFIPLGILNKVKYNKHGPNPSLPYPNSLDSNQYFISC